MKSGCIFLFQISDYLPKNFFRRTCTSFFSWACLLPLRQTKHDLEFSLTEAANPGFRHKSVVKLSYTTTLSVYVHSVTSQKNNRQHMPRIFYNSTLGFLHILPCKAMLHLKKTGHEHVFTMNCERHSIRPTASSYRHLTKNVIDSTTKLCNPGSDSSGGVLNKSYVNKAGATWQDRQTLFTGLHCSANILLFWHSSGSSSFIYDF